MCELKDIGILSNADKKINDSSVFIVKFKRPFIINLVDFEQISGIILSHLVAEVLKVIQTYCLCLKKNNAALNPKSLFRCFLVILT